MAETKTAGQKLKEALFCNDKSRANGAPLTR